MAVFKYIVAVILSVAFCIEAHATPHLVFDYKSGEIYAHNQAFDRWYPASLTKLMTVYTVLREIESGLISIKSPVKISANALSNPPSKMGFPVGTTLNFDNAIKIIMVKSANDVAVAIAESAAGTEARFVDLMNMNAGRLGMKNSKFKNPHGLHHDDQFTSARDMGVLAKALIDEFPQHAGYFNISAIKVGGRTLKNHNKLIHKLSGVHGMKTGFTCPSGLNVVVAREVGDKNLIAVVMGYSTGRERNIKAAELLNDALRLPAFEELGGFDEFYPKQMVKPAPNLRPIVCKKKKPKEKLSSQAKRMLLFSNSFRTIEEKEALLYEQPDNMANIIQVRLGDVHIPDPFALLRKKFKPLSTVMPQLSNFDGSSPEQPKQYDYALREIENNVVLSSANFNIPGVKKLPIPTANPERDERLAIIRHAKLIPRLSFPNATVPQQPEHYLDEIWKADWAPIQHREVFALKNGVRVTIPMFKRDFTNTIKGNEG